jgi:hypothetical protein
MAKRGLFRLLADYNAHVNRALFKILGDKAPTDALERPAGSYFDSILGMLNHLLVTDLAWLNAYRQSGLPFRSLDVPALSWSSPSIFPPKASNTFGATACMLPAARANGRTNPMWCGWLPRGGKSNNRRRIKTCGPTM